MSAFAGYAQYYAAFYRDKDYDAEADYVLRRLRTHGYADGEILELGCGQGGHALPLVRRGCSVSGIDRSPGMIEQANLRRAALPADEAARLRFAVGDIRNFALGHLANAVVSLFHVVSYLPTDDDLLAMFRNARAHLRVGAPLAFDFWYGEAVLRDEPAQRQRTVQVEGASVTRTASPRIDRGRCRVDVNYRFDVTPTNGEPPFGFEETHAMRYLFAQDIRSLCETSGFELVAIDEWMSQPPTPPMSWNGFTLARAV